MAYFTDKNGERVLVVTNDNLQDFFQYIETDKQYDGDIRVSDDVKLEDYFNKYESRNSDAKMSLVRALERSLQSNSPESRKNEVIDLARTNKNAFADLFNYSDNRSSGGCYEIVEERGKKNKFSDNLYMIDALLDRNNPYFLNGKKEDIRALPQDKAKILAKIFADAKSGINKYYSNQRGTIREGESQRIKLKLLERGDLLNYEPKNVNIAGISAGEIREEIDKTINEYNIFKLDKKFIFDGRRVNKDFLKLRFESQLRKDELVQTDGEQKAHNHTEMRAYTETRDLVLDAAECVVGKYIPNSRGEERTQTQKFKTLIEDLYGKPFKEFSGNKVVQDYLLSAAYRDIDAGNVTKLEDDALGLIVENDKDGYWLKKINEKSPETAKKVIREMNGRFGARQSRLADIIAPEITLDHGLSHSDTGNIYKTKVYIHHNEYEKGVANSTAMSINEKLEFLDKADVLVDENLLSKAKKDKEFAAEFRQDCAEHQDLCNQVYAKDKLSRSLSTLQGLYRSILDKFEDGNANDAETHLIKENVENVLKDFPNCRGLNIPKQGKLPMLFGRKKEEERRIELEQRVRKFNEELINFQLDVKNPQNAWGKYVDISAYKGKLLDHSTVEELDAQKDDGNLKVRENSQRLENKYYGKGRYRGSYNYDDAELAENNYDKTEQKSQNIKSEKQRVLARKKQLKEEAKEVLAPEISSLKAVTSDMDKDTKASIRKANQQITDTLEKPITERIKKVRGR